MHIITSHTYCTNHAIPINMWTSTSCSVHCGSLEMKVSIQSDSIGAEEELEDKGQKHLFNMYAQHHAITFNVLVGNVTKSSNVLSVLLVSEWKKDTQCQ